MPERPVGAAEAGWASIEHRLAFARAVPGAEADDGRWTLSWRGPALMGVLNVTPDSFSDGGRLPDAETAIRAGLAQWREGASFIDVGGESSRPGAEGVPADVELARVLPVVEGLAAAGARVSIDTVKPGVAREAVAAGACLVNDIGGLRLAEMREVCAEAGVPAVLMHMQGEPSTMQRDPRYGDVVDEVEAFLLTGARRALAEGVPAVAIDPGVGFGKALEHNLALLEASARLASHGLPLLVGASRKSLIARLMGDTPPLERLPGTLALHLAAAQGGAALLRVHDVAEHAQALAVWAALADVPARRGAARDG